MSYFKVLIVSGSKEYFIIFEIFKKIICRARFDETFDKPKKKGILFTFLQSKN